MTNKEKRFLELRFWLFCKNFTDLTGDIQLLFSQIEIFRFFSTMSSIHVQRLAYQMLMELQYKPDKTELVLLLKDLNYSVRDILKYVKISNTKYYKIIEETTTDPRAYYPKYTAEDHLQMEKFLTAITLFNKMGVQNDT